ncbi:MAG: glycosyl hydrolase, partial [Chloroflexi bacterium]|nr:glycosyl hydrolase [Chloroflexota bacterium]
DTTYVENYGTIFAFTESPHEPGVLWAGSDDGLVHLSRNGGGDWENVTPGDIPEWTRIDVIEVSPHQPSAAYISATRYKHDDVRPFLYKTKDFGATWEKIVDGIPEDDFTRVIREDTERPGLLYAGTETGIYVSFDDGETWQSLRCNLPVVPVTDLAVKGNELVASTNGRGFWILGDLAVLRQVGAQVADADVYLFKPAATYRFPAPRSRPVASGKNYSLGLGIAGTFYEKKTPDGETVRVLLDAGTNPPNGAVVTYLLKHEPEGEATLAFLDSKGQTIKSFGPKADEPKSDEPKSDEEEPFIPLKAGMNRFVWDLRYPDARNVEIEGARDKGLAGPLAPPGTYEVRLTVGEETQSQSFEIMMDPRIAATQTDLEEQHAMLIRTRDKLSECHDAINRLMSVRRQVDEWVRRSEAHGGPESVSETATKLKDKLSVIEGELIQLKAVGDLDTISHPARLNAKLAELTFVPSHADFGPTRQSHDVYEALSTQTDTQIQRLAEVIEQDLPVFVNLLHELEIPAIVRESTG